MDNQAIGIKSLDVWECWGDVEPSINQQLEQQQKKKKKIYWDLEAKVFPVLGKLCPNTLEGGVENLSVPEQG